MTNFFYFKACNCDGDGSNGTACDNNGVCSCKVNFMNGKCDVCNAGFFNFPTCEGNQYIDSTSMKLELYFVIFKACNCNGDGSTGITCDENGVCICKANFMNDKCDTCNAGFFNFPTCEGKP